MTGGTKRWNGLLGVVGSPPSSVPGLPTSEGHVKHP